MTEQARSLFLYHIFYSFYNPFIRSRVDTKTRNKPNQAETTRIKRINLNPPRTNPKTSPNQAETSRIKPNQTELSRKNPKQPESNRIMPQILLKPGSTRIKPIQAESSEKAKNACFRLYDRVFFQTNCHDTFGLCQGPSASFYDCVFFCQG